MNIRYNIFVDYPLNKSISPALISVGHQAAVFCTCSNICQDFPNKLITLAGTVQVHCLGSLPSCFFKATVVHLTAELACNPRLKKHTPSSELLSVVPSGACTPPFM